MKTAKKLLALLLVLVMTLAFGSVAAFAEETTADTHSITINNVESTTVYTAYKLFEVEYSYDEDSETTNYTYYLPYDTDLTLLSVLQDSIGLKLDLTADKSRYIVAQDTVDVDGEDVVVFVNTKTETGEMTVADLAAEIKSRISDEDSTLSRLWSGKGKESKYTANEDETKKGTATISGLDDGYYFVDASIGTIGILTTVAGEDVDDITAKNIAPSVDKKVKNSEGKWVDENSASIGDTVYFQTTIIAYNGAKNYVLHDEMSEGLTLNTDTDSIKVYLDSAEDGTELDSSYYEIITDTSKFDDNCTFEIRFNQEWLDAEINGETYIVVTYSAVLNVKAVIYNSGTSTSAVSNTNKVGLKFGDFGETTWDETETYVYQFDLVKTKKDNTILDGAKFQLYKDEDKKEIVYFTEETDEDGHVTYVVTSKDTTGAISTIEAGNVTIKGLEEGTYYLLETSAPTGYNKLTKMVEVTVSKDADLTASFDNDDKYVEGGVQVVNYTGSELPDTGGIGTTIFYIIGAALVVGAGVLLIVRKRMKAENEEN